MSIVPLSPLQPLCGSSKTYGAIRLFSWFSSTRDRYFPTKHSSHPHITVRCVNLWSLFILWYPYCDQFPIYNWIHPYIYQVHLSVFYCCQCCLVSATASLIFTWRHNPCAIPKGSIICVFKLFARQGSLMWTKCLNTAADTLCVR